MNYNNLILIHQFSLKFQKLRSYLIKGPKFTHRFCSNQDLMFSNSNYQLGIDTVNPRVTQLNRQNQIMEDQAIRQSKKALEALREIQEEQNGPFVKQNTKKTGNLENIKKQMQLQNLRMAFFSKISKNNIFDMPHYQQLLNPKQSHHKKFVPWKGFRLVYQKYILSVFYTIQMIFLIFTYVLSSFMSFIPHFVETKQQKSPIAMSVIIVSMVLCLAKMVIFSVLKKVHQGILLEYISDIFLNYVKTWMFYLDLIYLFLSFMLLIEMFQAQSVQNISRLSVYLFVCTMVRMLGQVENLIVLRNTFITGFIMDQFYKLFKLAIFNWILGHFVAVMLLAMSFMNNQQNWLISKQLDQTPWYIQYNWAFYWSATIMTTVGFGDYSATTHEQAHVVAYLQIISCIVLAYNISEIGNIIYAMRLANQQYLGKVAAFKRLAQANRINPQLQMKIESYLRQEKQIKEIFEYHQQLEIINSLPESLRRDFVLQSNNRIFRSLPFFRSLHKYTSIELGEAFVSKIEYPGEILVRANHCNQNIIILRQGKVGLAYNKLRSMLNGIIVQQIAQKSGNNILRLKSDHEMTPFLLTVQFLSPGKIVNYDTTVMEYSFVSRIHINKFIQIIKSNHQDMEYFFSTIHSHDSHEREWLQLPCGRCSINLHKRQNHSKQSKNFNQKRLSCQFYHSKFDCPKLHYFPWKKSIILKFIKKPCLPQPGSQIYRRKKQKSQSCLILRKRIFNKYQSKRFINEKKRFQKIVNSAQFRTLSKLRTLGSKRSSAFGLLKKNTYQPPCDPFLQKKPISLNYINDRFISSGDSSKDYGNSLLQEKQAEIIQQAFVEDQLKSIIEDTIKATVQEITPKSQSLHFWNLEIDLMYNYRNYFPKNNSSLFDNLSLCKFIKINKKKALTFLGQILKDIKSHPISSFQTTKNQDLLGLQNFKLCRNLDIGRSKPNLFPVKQNIVAIEQTFNSIIGQSSLVDKNVSNLRFEVNQAQLVEKKYQEKSTFVISEVKMSEKPSLDQFLMNEQKDKNQQQFE